jgi:hypothetical protein
MAPASAPSAPFTLAELSAAADIPLALSQAVPLMSGFFDQWRGQVDPLPPPSFHTNNPALADAMRYLLAMQAPSGSEDWMNFQAAVTINTLTMGPTGQLIGLPPTINGMMALTLEPGNTFQVGNDVLVNMTAIPINAIQNSDQSATVKELINANNQLMQGLINANALNNYILLTMEQAETHRHLLGHLYLPEPVQAQVSTENTELLKKLGLDSQALGVDSKARAMLEQVNEVLKDGDGLVVVYPSDIGVASAASLQSLATHAESMGLSPIHLGPVDDMFGISEELEDRVNNELSIKMPGKSKMEALAKKPLTQKRYLSAVDGLDNLLDKALVLRGKHGRHGTPWPEGTTFLESGVYYKQDTRSPEEKAADSVGERLPVPEPTKFLLSSGLVKTFSMVVLGLAAVGLILRSLSGRARKTTLEKELKPQRLPLLYLVQPEFFSAFLKALRLMTRIVTGNVGDLVGKHPQLGQQLLDLQQLMDKGIKLESLKGQPSKIPDSLKIPLNILIWIKDTLRKIPFFEEFLIWRGINLDSLQPELLMLINEFIKIEAVTWHFAKQAHMLSQVEMRADGLPEQLVRNLTTSRAEAKSILSAANQELAQLRLKTQPTAGELARISKLSTLMADMIFARRYQGALQQMDKNYSSFLLVKMIRMLLRELDRKDVNADYRTGVLEVLSLLEPLNLESIQIRTKAGLRVINIPAMLMENKSLLAQMLFNNHYDFLYMDGEAIPMPTPGQQLKAIWAA